MRREILEQPDVLARTLEALQPVARDLTRHRPERLLFLARGTSDNAATYGSYLAGLTAGIPTSLGAPSLATLYKAHVDLHGVLAVVISQSGETEELVEAASWSRRNGARTVAITNNEGSNLAAVCDAVLTTGAGTERAVPATKTHTSQLLAMALLVLSMADPQYSRDLLLVPGDAQQLVDAADHTAEAAGILVSAQGVFVAGRGYTLASAQEIALKIEETTGLICAGLSSADLQHGPAAALGPQHPLIVIQAYGPTAQGLAATARTAREAGSPVIVVGTDPTLRAQAHQAVEPSRLPEHLYPITGVIPGQIIAERLAVLLGRNPDAPAGLQKTTQTV